MQGKANWLDSVLIDLEPINCSLRLARSLDSDSSSPDSLSMDARLPRRANVRTPSDRSLREAEWSITLYNGGAGSAFSQEHKAIGQLDYLARMEPGIDDDGFPESCAAWAILDPASFALVRDMAVSGRLPECIRLRAQGLTYGWEPDGSGKVWDIEAKPHVAIGEIEIVTDLMNAPDQEAALPDVDDSWIQPKPESPELMVARESARLVEGVNSKLRWVVFLLAVTAVAVALR